MNPNQIAVTPDGRPVVGTIEQDKILGTEQTIRVQLATATVPLIQVSRTVINGERTGGNMAVDISAGAKYPGAIILAINRTTNRTMTLTLATGTTYVVQPSMSQQFEWTGTAWRSNFNLLAGGSDNEEKFLRYGEDGPEWYSATPLGPSTADDLPDGETKGITTLAGMAAANDIGAATGATTALKLANLCQNASETQEGVAELATAAEIVTGTDTGRVPNVANLKTSLASDGMWLTKRTKMPDGASQYQVLDGAWVSENIWGSYTNCSVIASSGRMIITAGATNERPGIFKTNTGIGGSPSGKNLRLTILDVPEIKSIRFENSSGTRVGMSFIRKDGYIFVNHILGEVGSFLALFFVFADSATANGKVITVLDTNIGNNVLSTGAITERGAMLASRLADTEQFFSRWYNKKVNFLGDSITAGALYEAPYRWINLVGQYLGLNTVRNYGVSGSLIAVKNGVSNSFVERYSAMDNDADLIIVMGGDNDQISGTGPLGLEDSTTNTDFYGALNLLITGLQEKYPSKNVAFIVPPMFNACQTPNGTGNLLMTEIRAAIINRCTARAVPYLDLWTHSGMDLLNSASHRSIYTYDGLHPNEVGHERIGNRVAAFVRSL